MQIADAGRESTTRSDVEFIVRPAFSADGPALAEFFTHIADDDRRIRFLSGPRTVSHDQLAALVRNDQQTD